MVSNFRGCLSGLVVRALDSGYRVWGSKPLVTCRKVRGALSHHSLVPSLRTAWDVFSVFEPCFFITTIKSMATNIKVAAQSIVCNNTPNFFHHRVPSTSSTEEQWSKAHNLHPHGVSSDAFPPPPENMWMKFFHSSQIWSLPDSLTFGAKNSD